MKDGSQRVSSWFYMMLGTPVSAYTCDLETNFIRAGKEIVVASPSCSSLKLLEEAFCTNVREYSCRKRGGSLSMTNT